ncbi:SOS response-associated peptidase [Agarivorans sp. TSD2052]|uniref:SOS response-associated peptidase family protein n=1 Tax=Agarivorans sp. TSD2052 TaxID=2937286 RepID=UPI00200D2E32|nr:SOS response-associated peptidase family protein [Agarivorans sp. TSD2052]UPW19417.1 SOS response-associated peptidase [Agarivorans sp. TSD2052]
MCGSVMIGGEYQIRQAVGVDSLFLEFGDNQQYRPGQRLPALSLSGQQLLCERYSWGVKSTYHPQRLINARIESAAHKTTFKNAWLKQRCLVPIKAWHEWRNQQRFEFSTQQVSPLFIAGLYFSEPQDDSQSMVVLTQTAVASLSEYHHRMPVLFTLEQGLQWLNGAAVNNDCSQFDFSVGSDSQQLALF